MTKSLQFIDRRQFLTGAAASLAAASTGWSAPKRRLAIGHTGITWGFKPENAQQAITDVGGLGYRGYETFGEVLEAWEPKGGLRVVLEEHHVPLISAYCNVNLTDRSKRRDEVDKIIRWAKLIRQNGGVTAVIGPNGVKRASYDFRENKDNIVAALNEICKAAGGAGVTPVLHQHTGTCIESRDEVYSVLESVDTKYVKFGPDAGQLAKGGVDPVEVIRHFLPIIRHIHLKDWGWRPQLGAVLPTRPRQGGHTQHPRSPREVERHENHHGGTGPQQNSSDDTDRNRTRQQGIS